MLDDDVTGDLKDIVCGPNYLADGFRKICAIYLQIGPAHITGFETEYGVPGRQLKAAIDALAAYLENTPCPALLAQNQTVTENEFDLIAHSRLAQLYSQCFETLDRFGERHAMRSPKDFMVMAYYGIRLQFATACIFTMLGDATLVIGMHAHENKTMAERLAVHHILMATIWYRMAQRDLRETLEGVRHVKTELTNYIDKEGREGGLVAALLNLFGTVGQAAGVGFQIGRRLGAAYNKDQLLAPFVASETLLFEMMDGLHKRLQAFESDGE